MRRNHALQVVHTGLKCFEYNKRGTECKYRLNQEGVHIVLPFLTKRKVTLGVDDFIVALRKSLAEPEIEGGHKGLIRSGDFSAAGQTALKAIEDTVGSFVFVLGEDARAPTEFTFAAVAWMGTNSMQLLIKANLAESMLNQLTFETSAAGTAAAAAAFAAAAES